MKHPTIVFALSILCLAIPPTLHAEDSTSTLTDSAAREDRELPDVDAPSTEEITGAIQRGVDFLLQDQNPNGSWGSATRTKGLNIYAPVPGAHHAFRTATTSLCISALLEYRSDRTDVAESIAKAENWLVAHLPDLKRATGEAIYNVWGHGYSIQALVRLHQHYSDDVEKQQRFKQLIELQFERLSQYESVDGGWG